LGYHAGVNRLRIPGSGDSGTRSRQGQERTGAGDVSCQTTDPHDEEPRRQNPKLIQQQATLHPSFTEDSTPRVTQPPSPKLHHPQGHEAWYGRRLAPIPRCRLVSDRKLAHLLPAPVSPAPTRVEGGRAASFTTRRALPALLSGLVGPLSTTSRIASWEVKHTLTDERPAFCSPHSHAQVAPDPRRSPERARGREAAAARSPHRCLPIPLQRRPSPTLSAWWRSEPRRQPPLQSAPVPPSSWTGLRQSAPTAGRKKLSGGGDCRSHFVPKPCLESPGPCHIHWLQNMREVRRKRYPHSVVLPEDLQRPQVPSRRSKHHEQGHSMIGRSLLHPMILNAFAEQTRPFHPRLPDDPTIPRHGDQAHLRPASEHGLRILQIRDDKHRPRILPPAIEASHHREVV
jgi:hypothetical protein